MQQRANGVLSYYDWDSISRLRGLSHDLSGTANDAVFVYAYNPAGQVVSRQGYGPAYQAARPYEYTVATYDGLNRVTSLNGQAVGYNDGRGSVTYLPPRAQQPGRDFAYDAERRLTYATPYSYSDDALGRLSSASGPAARRFQHDGEQLATETGVDTITVLTRHVPSDVLNATVATFESGNTSSPVWPITDERGSVIALTDSNGSPAWFTTYDEYGQVVGGGPSRFGYAGQVNLLPDLQDMHARNYVPSLGRFLQPDPMGYAAGANLYAYVGGDPVNAVDPLGLQESTTVREITGWGCPRGTRYSERSGSCQLRYTGAVGRASSASRSGNVGGGSPAAATGSTQSRLVCEAGTYTNVGLTAGANGGVIQMYGASVIFGVSVPDRGINGGGFFAQFQLTETVGAGAAVGAGAGLAFSRSDAPLNTGAERSSVAEFILGPLAVLSQRGETSASGTRGRLNSRARINVRARVGPRVGVFAGAGEALTFTGRFGPRC